jgi:hypothetical protein
MNDGGVRRGGTETDDEHVLGGYAKALLLIGGGILEIIAVFAFSAAQLRRRMRNAILPKKGVKIRKRQ